MRRPKWSDPAIYLSCGKAFVRLVWDPGVQRYVREDNPPHEVTPFESLDFAALETKVLDAYEKVDKDA